jgi:hypothetical protein
LQNRQQTRSQHCLIAATQKEDVMNDHDRIIFDLKGYVVKPAVLSMDEVEELRSFVLRQRREPDALPPHQRRLPGGPVERLIDHPAVLDVLRDVIDPDVEKIRLENVFLSCREAGEGKWEPHAGGRTTNPNYAYNFHDGRIYAGMTRVVWELNEVRQDQGGTCFIPGSHKANFPIRKGPASIDARDSGLWESYGCPPGSLVIFSEAVRHSADVWRHPEHPRVALFFAYNHINVRHHKPEFPEEVISGLTPEHQRFFREVYHPQFDRRAA